MNTETTTHEAAVPSGRVNAGLLRRLGLFTTTMMVVGAVIGSGIFRKPGVMAGDLIGQGVGAPELLLGVWILAGIITLMGALTNAEIAGMIPETGGQYVFFEKMYGPFAAYLYGWAVFAVIQTGSIAGIAYVFAEYATQFIALPDASASAAAWSFHIPGLGDIQPLKEFGVKSIAALLIILLTIVNYLGVRFGGMIQNIFTVAKVAAILVVVVLAFTLPGVGSMENATTSAPGTRLAGLALFAAIAAALQGAFWAYDGWNNITYICGEVRNPQRNIPRGLMYGMGVIIIVYVLINLAYTYVLPIEAMAASKLVAADVAEKFFSGGGRWIAAAVMVSTFGTVNGTILASARVYFSMARHNVFPRFLGTTHARYHTPGASLLVQCIWSVLLLLSGTFDNLTDMLIFVSWIFYAAGAYGVFVLRRKMPDAHRPYRVPLYPVLPWIFVIFAAAYLVLTIYNDIAGYQALVAAGEPARINSAIGLVLVLIGTPIYFYYRSRKPAAGAPATPSPVESDRTG